MHLINCTKEEKDNWHKHVPVRFEGIGDELLPKIAASKPEQLANGAKLKKGQLIAYVDIMKDGDVIRRAPMYAPHEGTVFMAPRDPDIPAAQSEYVLMVMRYHRKLNVLLPHQQPVKWTQEGARQSASAAVRY